MSAIQSMSAIENMSAIQNMSDPAVTMNTIQISANLLFGKVMDSLAILFLIFGLGLIGFIAYWYVKVRHGK